MKPVDMVSSGENVSNRVASDKLQDRQSPVREGHVLKQNPVSEDCELQSDKVDSSPTAEPRKEPIEKPDTIKLRSDQGGISPIAYQKVAATTEIIPAPQIVSEATSPSIIREKVSEDGYHWRKYGQKLVKGNEFVRSYYRCTHPNCQAKKQLDCTHNGQITDTLYFGQHGHPKFPNLPLAVGFVVSVVEERPKDSPTSVSKDKSSNARGQTPQQIEPKQNAQLSAAASDDVKSPVSQLNRMKDAGDNDDRPGPKRRKKDNHNNNATLVDNKPTGEARVVVQTFSEVDIVNDGYRWRKYGQKMVKGSPNPRNYYRCSSSGCPAKKHVERASHDSKLVITTYEGRHDHDMPPSRTVTHNIGMPTPNNCETGRKLEEADVVCRGTVHLNSGNHVKSNEQLNGKLSTVPQIGSKDGQSFINSESKAIEQQYDELSTRSEGTDAENDATSFLEGKPNNQRNSEASNKPENKDKSETKDTPCREMGETTFNQQEQTPKAEPVRS